MIIKLVVECLMSERQFSSVAQSCPTLCHPMDCSTPGFPVHYQLPELTQTHVHPVSDSIQSSNPLSSPSPSAFNLHIGSLKVVYPIMCALIIYIFHMIHVLPW